MTQSGWKQLVTSKTWNHKQADKIYFSSPPFFTIPGEKGRHTWLCSGYLGMCPLSTDFINYEKKYTAHSPLVHEPGIVLYRITDLPLEKLNIGVFDLFVHSFRKSIFVIIALIPIRLFPKAANVFLECEKCWQRQLDSADLPDTALHTRTKQIGRISEGQAKGNYCSVLPSAFC